MNQNNKELKIKLLELLFNKEITKEQFKKVIKYGLVCPIELEREETEKTPQQKEIESLHWIYEKLGQNIVRITFRDLSKL